jgi:signal transduction histidine kinase
MTEVRKVRLLVVDDEVAQMQALRDTLGDHGYETTGCTSGEAALAALRAEPFDLLLADLMMPGMDGIALLRAALEVDPLLVAIIMTGAGTIASAVEAMQSGALDYILKPFKLSAILPVLSRGLTIRRLRMQNAALERSVRERSAELEAANVELDAFTRSASHDLRSPLNAVIGFSDLLAATYGRQWPAEAVHWLSRIQQSGRRMNQLIDDLLRLSQLGRQALNVELVDVGALVRSVVDELANAQPERRVTVVIEPLPLVRADASLLRQVFVNLLSNADKFTRRTIEPRVEVGCARQGKELVFSIRDNGSGFDMAHAHRLFRAFERLHGATDFEGTGVGLSIVQRIVQRHGGRIWAEGEPGHGAAFHFTLDGSL